MSKENLKCLDCGTDDETVKLRTSSDRNDGKHFPRCKPCADEREARAQKISRRLASYGLSNW